MAVDGKEDRRTVIPTIIVLILATTAVAAVYLAPRLGEERVQFVAAPDRPCAFGYSMAWLAIRSRDTRAVAEALRVGEATPCNWNSGIGAVYDGKLGETHIFISPPVGTWTFVVGLPLPHPMGRSFVDKSTPLLIALGGRFPEAQYFFAYPPLDFFAWARMLEGRLVRAFAIGDEGLIWSKGRTTREERALGLKLFELRGVKGRRGDAGGEMILHPTEDHVMRIAQAWSLDPTRLDGIKADAALGLICEAPAAWKAERMRKTA
jgi:hypothetical protein